MSISSIETRLPLVNGADFSNQATSMESQVRGAAASKIQTCWRNRLPAIHLKKAKEYIKNPTKLSSLPTPGVGKSLVYLPRDIPLVLKQGSRDKIRNRFEKMEQARNFCERQNLSYLIVPRASIYRDWLIEERLPIELHNTKHQVELYQNNQEAFTTVIQQLTRFLCQNRLDSITRGNGRDPYYRYFNSYLTEGHRMPRYDNLPLFLENKQGKIGLVDLERLFVNEKPQSIVYECERLILFFPQHYSTIISHASPVDTTLWKNPNPTRLSNTKVAAFFFHKKVLSSGLAEG